MLKFFREKAQVIGWVIVIVFGGTMFAGSLFFRKAYKANKAYEANQPINTLDSIAILGNISLTKGKFYEVYFQALSEFKSKNLNKVIPPEIKELLMYSAFNQGLQFSIILDGAKRNDIKASRADLKRNLSLIYKQYNLRGKKDLKEMLKKNGVSYSNFINDVKQNIIVQKFVETLMAKVSVTDKDIENKYTEIKLKHILIKPDLTDTKEILAKEKVANILVKINEGLSFEDAAKKYSDDTVTSLLGGDLGWLAINKADPNFEEAAYLLEVNEISKPVKSAHGYHLIKMTEKKILPRPKDLDIQKEKAELLQLKKEQTVASYIQTVQNKNKLEIFDPMIKAYKSKIEGDYNSAINAYQTLVTKSPASPVPHYLLAKVYTMLGDSKNAKHEALKAEIKGTINPELDIPQTYIVLGDILLEETYKNRKLPKKTRDEIKVKIMRKKAVHKYQLKKMMGKSYSASNSKNFSTPDVSDIIRTEIGKTISERRLPKLAMTKYDKALVLSDGDLIGLKQLQELFLELNAQSRSKKVAAKIAAIEKQAKELKDQKNTEEIKLDIDNLNIDIKN
jgi:parvulin-like peptidyl-prolyl isomerase